MNLNTQKKELQEYINSFYCKHELVRISQVLDDINNYDMGMIATFGFAYEVSFSNKQNCSAFEKEITELGFDCKRLNEKEVSVVLRFRFDIFSVVHIHFYIYSIIQEFSGICEAFSTITERFTPEGTQEDLDPFSRLSVRKY